MPSRGMLETLFATTSSLGLESGIRLLTHSVMTRNQYRVKLRQIAPRNRYQRMSRSLRAYSDRSNEEEADAFRRRFREIISKAMEVPSGLLVALSRDNIKTLKTMSAARPKRIAEYLTIDEGSQDAQRFNKPVSRRGQRVHEGKRRFHGSTRESLRKQKVVYRRSGRSRRRGWDKEGVGL